MRTVAILGWLVLPVLAGAYHYGPGQDRLRMDDAAAALDEANRLSKAGEHEAAGAAYEQALALLPTERKADAQRARLERAKEQMYAKLLPEAAADLKGLVEQMEGDSTTDPAILADARETLANSQYYLTWLMRLEGLGREKWEPEIESSRQEYRMLAEDAEQAGDEKAAEGYRESLESVVRLARMDPGELQGLPIPKQCQGCKSGQCKNPGRKPGRKPSNSEKKDNRGASSGPPPDGAGS